MRMGMIVFNSVFVLFCILSVLGEIGGVICRSCNLSLPFHGCLLDFGTCKTKAGQYCIKQIYSRGGIHWFSVKGCTENGNECFQRVGTQHATHSTHCCYHPLCNL